MIIEIILYLFLLLLPNLGEALPKDFVYLQDIAPDIQQDIKYAQTNNFIGQKIPGYHTGVCILTHKTAEQLKRAQKALSRKGLTLKVYDCYRPKMAVNAFYQWSKNTTDTRMKNQFYPRELKSNLFDKGYIALYSGHSRGSTVDLTLIKSNTKVPKNPLARCYATSRRYLNDNSIDMGTRFDCLDKSAHYHYSGCSKTQKANRQLLRKIMTEFGFKPYSKEWWHFTLRNEPYPRTYFDFPVQ